MPYAVPYECVPTLMCINKSLLESEGITVPSGDWTWEDFYNICARVTRDTDGDGEIDQFGCCGYTWQDALTANGASLFTEDGIRAAIQGNLAAIEAGRRPAVQLRPQYRPYQKYPRYTGFLALYVHYLYLLGKIGKRQYPPRMTPQLWQEVMRFEQYREQFAFLRDNGITTRTDMAAFTARTEETLANLMKQRTVLNVRRKRRRALYTALADAEALAPVKELYEAGLSGMETEFAQYMDAVAALEQCGVPREGLIQEKAELYDRLAELNRQIRAERRKLALCRKTQNSLPRMEQEIDKAEARESEVRTNEHRRR